jgi:hypothetical protein
LKRTRSQMTSNFYVSNWKSSYDIDNEMARNIARVKKKYGYYRFYSTRKSRYFINIYIINIVSATEPSMYINFVLILFYWNGLPLIKEIWTVMVNNFTTNINKRTISHLTSLNIKKTMTYDGGNPCPGWERHKMWRGQ